MCTTVSRATNASSLTANLIPLTRGQSVLLSPWLHHASIVPWLQRSQKESIEIKYIQSPPSGRFPINSLTQQLHPSTAVAVIPLVNMVYGTINPIQEITHQLHEQEIVVVVDGTHAVGHIPINLQAMNCDAFYCSGNIGLMGPLGTGVLYLCPNILERELPSPIIIGDGAVQSVTYNGFQLLPPPERYEAGIIPIPNFMGLETAIQYLEQVSLPRLADYEHQLINHLLSHLQEVPHIVLYGDREPTERVGLLGFNIEGLNPHDLSLPH